MSFTPLMMKVVASLLDDLPTHPTVVELGNQTFDPTISGTLTAPHDLMLPRVLEFLDRRGKLFDRKALTDLMALSVEKQKPHTATFFRALGFAQYTAIDVNSKYGSLVMDLNVDLHDHYGFNRKFELVTNNGTGEHIFNQWMVFKNMHQLALEGGVLLFVLPFYNWLNHGFFNFNPILFTDLAAANDYEVIRLSVACPVGQEVTAQEARVSAEEMRLPWQPPTASLEIDDFRRRGAIFPRTPRKMLGSLASWLRGRPPSRQGSKLPGVVESLAERVPNINVVAALRKTRDRPFAMPLQGMYAGSNVEASDLRTHYKVAP
jgi:hypothetical protein